MGSNISQMRSSSSSSSRESVNTNRQQIPEDVILDILSRLPAKSVVRFRRVSRTWCSFTHDPFFASLHHDRSITRDKGNALLLSYPDPSSSSTSFSFFERKQGFRNLQISHVDQQYARLSESSEAFSAYMIAEAIVLTYVFTTQETITFHGVKYIGRVLASILILFTNLDILSASIPPQGITKCLIL
uniref:F-box domain-containing protein n=1 Tax=Salix viminalis TaxID=40686 RepID=A0A6N2NFF7_SALVM